MNFNIVATIHLDRLRHNFKQICDIVGNGVSIIPVIKADGYGHGMVEMAKVLSDYDRVSHLGVAHTKEAVLLRKTGIDKDILVMSCINESDFEIMHALNITPVIHSIRLLEGLIEFLKQSGKKMKVHLKFNTGMSRLGIDENDAEAVLRLCKREEQNVEVEGLMSHFSDSESDKEWTIRQNDKFKKIADFFESDGFFVKYKHIANSGAILQYKQTHFNCVRPGLALYGYAPSEYLKNTVDLKPILDVKSHLISIHKLGKGEGISYGRTFKAEKDMVVGVVAFGYADGLFRNLSNKIECLIKGKRCRGIGNVCMDMFMCDITDMEASLSDEVVIIGSSGKETITADELAKKSGTINYEILTNIAKSIRVRRVYNK